MIGVETLGRLNLAAALTECRKKMVPYRFYNADQVKDIDLRSLPRVSYQVPGFGPGQEWEVDLAKSEDGQQVRSIDGVLREIEYLVREGFGLYFGVTVDRGSRIRVTAFAKDETAGL